MIMEKRALITGANRGIGLETAKRLFEKGYDIVAVARSFDALDATWREKLTTIPYDLTDIEGIPALMRCVGPVDVLINNAGMMLSLPYDDYPEDKVRQILRLNLEAPIALMREAGNAMAAAGSGRIVNNASIAAHTGHPDVWYGATKAGILNATKSFAALLGPSGVVVNAVCAGPVDTDMLQTIPEARKAAIKSRVFSGRFAYAEEVAQTMVWLATDSPEYINGASIDINNGAFPR
jgi:NAD(P)-dependent dehydrogenase (short-subunit alcohol dehydrogenase family)